MGSAFHQLCPRYSGTLTPTAPTAIRLWDTFTFTIDWPHAFVSPSTFSRRAVVSYWRKYVHEVLVNRLGGLSLPRKSVVRLTDRPDMTLNVYRGRKTTVQQCNMVKSSQKCLHGPSGSSRITGSWVKVLPESRLLELKQCFFAQSPFQSPS